MGAGEVTKRGARIWDFVATLIAARRAFVSIHARYEHRVLTAAREHDVPRADLKLPPDELWKLFHLGRLERLRDGRLKLLRELAKDIFGPAGDDGLMDAYCGHIYHEMSILNEEHRSVGRFIQQHDPRRYRALFEEVTGYYPLRLGRVQRFFRAARRRLDELLPGWSQERILVRSAFLFGDQLSRRAWGEGREALYVRMYPGEGLIRGYLEAGRSFFLSGFLDQAREALTLSEQAGTMLQNPATPAQDEALREVRELLARLAPVAAASPEAGALTKGAP